MNLAMLAESSVAEVGWLLVATGLGWALWAAAWLRRAGNRLASGAVPAVLVDEGPYRVSRHPMLLGTALATAGLAPATGALLWLGVAGLGVAAANRWLIPAEEARLAQAFGGWWRDYAASVPRWW